jgi:4-hydroxybenzoate polyprenyltransferase
MSSSSGGISFLVRLGTFIRFSHTVFALPFGLISMAVAGNGTFRPALVGWILICMVATRTAAMCFNRLVDWEIDKENPRTADRHTLLTRGQGWTVLCLASALAIYASHALNTLCFRLSPLMLGIVFFYSLTKRFTAFSHLFLGIALGVAPMGAWAAVRGTLLDSPAPWILASGVVLWTFGFDLIYSTLDAEFDRRKGLFSFPSRFGVPASLSLARILHGGAALAFAGFGLSAGLGPAYWVAIAVAAIALVWEHRLAASPHPQHINQAFFQINALVSLALLAGVAVHLLLWKSLFP